MEIKTVDDIVVALQNGYTYDWLPFRESVPHLEWKKGNIFLVGDVIRISRGVNADGHGGKGTVLIETLPMARRRSFSDGRIEMTPCRELALFPVTEKMIDSALKITNLKDSEGRGTCLRLSVDHDPSVPEIWTVDFFLPSSAFAKKNRALMGEVMNGAYDPAAIRAVLNDDVPFEEIIIYAPEHYHRFAP